MEAYSEHIKQNLEQCSGYYSLTCWENLERCQVDREYLGELLLVHEDLIWRSIHKYVGKPEMIARAYCLDKEDILQLGRLGMIKAVRAFDTGRGVRFSSFAVKVIAREVKCFLQDYGSSFIDAASLSEHETKVLLLHLQG